MADYESVLCVKNEVFVYQIPARTSNRGYRAADWKLDEPDWTGRLKVVTKGRDLSVKLEDKNSGELFALCPVDTYPTSVIEQVLDSSRYFVIRIQDGNGRHAFIGIGFADRGDSFDLLVAIQDHFKHVKRDDVTKIEEASAGAAALDAGPKLDLSFKEGQTIKLNFATKLPGDAAAAAKSKPRGQVGASPLLLPPPPGGSRVTIPAPRASPLGPPSQPAPIGSLSQTRTGVTGPAPARTASQPASSVDLLLDLTPSMPAQSVQQRGPTAAAASNEWDDFTGAIASKLTIQPAPVKKSDPNVLSWENFE